METYQQHKKLFLFGGIFLVLVILYWLFFSGGGDTAPNVPTSPTGGLVTEVAESSSDQIVGRELLNLLAEIQTISLDFSIFENPVFSSLQDWSKPIEPQPLGQTLGRKNPFSDFSSDASVAGARAAQQVAPANAPTQ
ncbi:MAG: hypothetical protein V4467_02505 [Patescibacteria group bacterium]